MKNVSKQLSIVFLITLMINFIFCGFFCKTSANSSNKLAEGYYFKADRAPYVTFNVKSQNYVKILLKDGGGVKDLKIELKVGKEYKTINKNYLTVSNDKKTIKIDKSFFPIDKMKYLRITASDNDKYSNKSITTCQIKRLKKKTSSGNYYFINRSPRVKYFTTYYSKNYEYKWIISNSEDNNKIKQSKYIDLNNNNKVIDEDYTKSSKYLYMYLDSKYLTLKNGKYKIKHIATDYNGMQTVEEIYLTMNKKLVDIEEIDEIN